jgi:hypothetical protein
MINGFPPLWNVAACLIVKEARASSIVALINQE